LVRHAAADVIGDADTIEMQRILLTDFLQIRLERYEISLETIALTKQNCPYTVVHDFNGHGVNGMHGVNGKNCYDGPFYVVNNGKIHVWL